MGARTLVIGALLLVAPEIGEACQCPGMPPCQKLWMADAVFTGVVTNISFSERARKEGGTYRYSHTTFVVERTFRGAGGQGRLAQLQALGEQVRRHRQALLLAPVLVASPQR